MPGTLRHLPPVAIPGHTASGLGTDDHPMRIMTRRAAGLLDEPWDDDARAAVAAIFDSLAPEWHTRTSPEREAVVADALRRGLPADTPGRVCVEVGSGTGAYTPMLGERWDRVVAVELSLEMHRRAPVGAGHRILADGSNLPLPDVAADAVVLVNCFLFPAEVDRVLGPGGVVVWVNSSGPATPIHLTGEEVLAVLPGTWEGVTSGAGEGTWAVLQRGAR